MDRTLLREHDAMWNNGLGAIALAAFIRAYCSRLGADSLGPTLWHLLSVLPLVYPEKCRRVILKRRTFRGIVERDPEEDVARGEITFRLAGRMQMMQSRTFASLNLALAMGFVAPAEGHFGAARPLRIPKDAGSETRAVIRAAEKLGNWAAEVSSFEYLAVLGVDPRA